MSPKERLEFFFACFEISTGVGVCQNVVFFQGGGGCSVQCIFVFVQNVSYEEDCESGTKEIGRSHSKSKQHINGKSIIIIIFLR